MPAVRRSGTRRRACAGSERLAGSSASRIRLFGRDRGRIGRRLDRRAPSASTSASTASSDICTASTQVCARCVRSLPPLRARRRAPTLRCGSLRALSRVPEWWRPAHRRRRAACRAASSAARSSSRSASSARIVFVERPFAVRDRLQQLLASGCVCPRSSDSAAIRCSSSRAASAVAPHRGERRGALDAVPRGRRVPSGPSFSSTAASRAAGRLRCASASRSSAARCSSSRRPIAACASARARIERDTLLLGLPPLEADCFRLACQAQRVLASCAAARRARRSLFLPVLLRREGSDCADGLRRCVTSRAAVASMQRRQRRRDRRRSARAAP